MFGFIRCGCGWFCWDGRMDNPKALFERVMDSMVRAGWLHSHVFTEGKGHHLGWTPEGTKLAQSLQHITTFYALEDRDDAPYLFYVACHSGSLDTGHGGPVDIDPDIADLFRQCVADLNLYGDKDGLQALVHIVAGWTPDGETVIRFV